MPIILNIKYQLSKRSQNRLFHEVMIILLSITFKVSLCTLISTVKYKPLELSEYIVLSYHKTKKKRIFISFRMTNECL